MQVTVPRLINLDSKTYQVNIHTAWIDTVLTQRFRSVKQSRQLPWATELEATKFKHNPAFWAKYALLQHHPLETEIQNSLEKQASLEYQFRENASKIE